MFTEWSETFHRQAVVVDFRIHPKLTATELIDFARGNGAIVDDQPPRVVVRFVGKPAEDVAFPQVARRLAVEKSAGLE